MINTNGLFLIVVVLPCHCKEDIPATNVNLIQLKKKGEKMVKGVVKGQRGVFKFVLIPDGSSIQGSANVTVDDTNVTLSSNGDGTFNVDTVATDTLDSFNLHYQATSSDGVTKIDRTFNVPLLTVTPPPPVPATDVDLVQLS